MADVVPQMNMPPLRGAPRLTAGGTDIGGVASGCCSPKNVNTANDPGVSSRFSKRRFLRALMHKTPKEKNQIQQGCYESTNKDVAGSSAKTNATKVSTSMVQGRVSPPHSSAWTALRSPRASARSDVNANKPLPSRPAPGTIDKPDGHPPKPVLKLERIMASLSDAEIEKLFSGAPQFFARSQGLGTGPPHPSVAFPWDEELAIRDLTDYVHIENDAWGCVTARPRIILRDPMSATSPTGKKRPHFNTRCQERPSMLSMQGLEKGTVGYQAALELSVADTLLEEQYGFDSLGSKGHVIVEQRQKLITSKDGLRHLDDAVVMEQLLKVEQRYYAEREGLRIKSHELYNEIFTKVLHPPTRVIDHNDPYSLAVQIHALVKVLATPNAWIDFSRVEWRIRLGQILWGFPLDDELDDGSAINEGIDADDRGEERYWFLLQVLLSCELLIRLDAITEGEEYGMQRLKASEVHRFEKEANPSVKWSLLLARTWLDNITVIKTNAVHEEPSTPKGWLTTFTSKMHLRHEHMHGAYYTDHTQHRHNAQTEYTYAIKGRYNERQVFGLTQFARKLRWPDVEAFVFKINEQAPILGKETPVNTPLPPSLIQRPSYFGGDRTSVNISRRAGRRRRLGAALHTSGWLSKVYISGLILPGEALSHHLMSSLLENDTEAMEKLAAGSGSVECMGWISTDITPEGHGDGWLDIEVDNIAEDMARTGKKARLWGKTVIERESDVLGDADPSNVLPADFVIPNENQYFTPPPSNIRVELKSLNLSAPVDSVCPTPSLSKQATQSPDASKPPVIHTYPASVAFTITHDGIEQQQELNMALSSDVYFVTAHPCAPSSRVKFLKSPTSPTIQQIDVGGYDFSGKSSSAAHITGHPLHRYYTYASIHLLDLLSQPGNATLEDLLSRSASANRSATTTPSSPVRAPVVLVIDCITGFAPPRSPDNDALSLSRVSSLSSSFGLEPINTGAPPLQIPEPPHPRNRLPSAASFGSSRFERVDPPPPPNGGTTTAGSATTPPSESTRMPSRLGNARRRQFGSDLEVLARALCAERGWNALISRRRRGCLACAIREAGALGWRVVVRVE
ncbi:hypothetical protein DL770_003098 [Monosporascus sp. CRB-9-2]|nr:hypothetical protein DL770_003098 [Monosporascus sp. CRB-9-2]